MSWMVSLVGKTEDVVRALDEHSHTLAGASLREYDAVKPLLQSLVAGNFQKPESRMVPRAVRIEARGEGMTQDGKPVYGLLSVTIEPVAGAYVS